MTKSNTHYSAGRALVTIGLIAFAAGLLVMLALTRYSTPDNHVAIIFTSALLLAAIIAPSVYALVVGPVAASYEDGKAGSTPAIQAALIDPITRLPNRHGITSNLLEFMAHAERYNTPLSIALVKVADFKKLSEELAPRGGEKVLQSMAEVFYDTLRMPDKAGRYDNEEFLVVLPHTKLKDANLIVERIRATADAKKLDQDGKNQNKKMTVSIGAVQLNKGEDLEQLLSRAEQAKQAKARRAPAKKTAK